MSEIHGAPGVRAKFTCLSKVDQVGGAESADGPVGQVYFTPVFEGKPDVEGNACLENAIFGKYTPSGSIEMLILNPTAYARFTAGEDYYIDFTNAADVQSYEDQMAVPSDGDDAAEPITADDDEEVVIDGEDLSEEQRDDLQEASA